MTLRKTWSETVGAGVAALFLSVWGLGWSAGTLFFDVDALDGLYETARSQSFPATQGTIRKSRVDVEYDEGTSYTVEVEYDYQVAGQKFVSSRFRWTQSSGSAEWTQAQVAARPPGAVVPVFYDPDNPAQAVLDRDFAMCDLFLPLFMIPFNLIMIGVWAMVYSLLRTRGDEDLPWGTELLVAPDGCRLRLPGVLPGFSALAAAGATAFGLVFVLGFGFDLHGPIWPAVVGWVLVLAAYFGTYYWAKRRLESGEFDLVIDEVRGLVSLPGDELNAHEPSPRRELAATIIETRTISDSDGEIKKYFTYFKTCEGRRLRLFEWTSERDAEWLANWLANRLGLEVVREQSSENHSA